MYINIPPKGKLVMPPIDVDDEPLSEEELMKEVYDYLDELEKSKDTNLEMVREFHKKFNHPIESKPTIGDSKRNVLRVALIQEELNELDQALMNKDKVGVLDALLDLQYVLDGAFLSLGFSSVKQEGFKRVHKSNMSKLGPDSKPIYNKDGKVMKGPNYKPVDLKDLV